MKHMLVVTPDMDELRYKDLELIMQQLKDEGCWVEEATMPDVLEVFRGFDEQVKGARHRVAEQVTELLQEICPGVKVVFTDVETLLVGAPGDKIEVKK